METGSNAWVHESVASAGSGSPGGGLLMRAHPAVTLGLGFLGVVPSLGASAMGTWCPVVASVISSSSIRILEVERSDACPWDALDLVEGVKFSSKDLQQGDKFSAEIMKWDAMGPHGVVVGFDVRKMKKLK